MIMQEQVSGAEFCRHFSNACVIFLLGMLSLHGAAMGKPIYVLVKIIPCTTVAPDTIKPGLETACCWNERMLASGPCRSILGIHGITEGRSSPLTLTGPKGGLLDLRLPRAPNLLLPPALI
jgi:hypothetical protein